MSGRLATFNPNDIYSTVCYVLVLQYLTFFSFTSLAQFSTYKSSKNCLAAKFSNQALYDQVFFKWLMSVELLKHTLWYFLITIIIIVWSMSNQTLLV